MVFFEIHFVYFNIFQARQTSITTKHQSIFYDVILYYPSLTAFKFLKSPDFMEP